MFAIKISGMLGIGRGVVLGDLKQAVIEMVAAKSGLWKFNVMTENGKIEQIRTKPSDKTLDTINKYTLLNA